jgi:hypothetical protein
MTNFGVYLVIMKIRRVHGFKLPNFELNIVFEGSGKVVKIGPILRPNYYNHV